MDRLIAPGSVNLAGADTAPAVGTPQYATGGVPGVTPATQWPAYAFNAIQDELMAIITAAGITPDKNNWGQVLAALKIVTVGRLLNVQTFLANGTYTPTAGMASVIFEAQGGGGGGGGTGATGGASSAAGGAGSCGAYARGKFLAAAIGVSQAVTVGAAGIGNLSANGGVGGLSSVGALISAPGGLGGLVGVAVSVFPASTAGGATTAAPTGGNVEAISGFGGGYGLVLALSASLPGFAYPSRMGLYGNGGPGSNTGASAAATAGSPGIIGKVIAWEYS